MSARGQVRPSDEAAKQEEKSARTPGRVLGRLARQMGHRCWPARGVLLIKLCMHSRSKLCVHGSAIWSNSTFRHIEITSKSQPYQATLGCVRDQVKDRVGLLGGDLAGGLRRKVLAPLKQGETSPVIPLGYIVFRTGKPIGDSEIASILTLNIFWLHAESESG